MLFAINSINLAAGRFAALRSAGKDVFMTSDETKQMIEDLVALSREAGKAILEVYQSEFAVERKDDKSPLTLADKRSHEIINSSLQRTYPYPVLSEEGRNIPYEERRAWDTFWLIDPLDGTKEFIGRNGQFTVNIALIRGNRPVLGVILVPVTGEVYHAAKGRGAFRIHEGAEERLPLRTRHEVFTVVGSRSHSSPEQEEYISSLRKQYGEIDFVSAGSSLKFCLVGEGQADLYPRLGPTMEWDTAAGQIIVEEAGGKVLQFGKETPLEYNKKDLLNPRFIVHGNTRREWS